MSKELRVESDELSSSDIIVTGDEHGMEITLDPMTHPIRRLDVYRTEAKAFVDAVNEAFEEVVTPGEEA